METYEVLTIFACLMAFVVGLIMGGTSACTSHCDEVCGCESTCASLGMEHYNSGSEDCWCLNKDGEPITVPVRGGD